MNPTTKLVAASLAGLAGAVAIGVGTAGASMQMPPPCNPGQTPQMGPGGMPSCMPPGFGGNGGAGGPIPGGVGGNGGSGGPGNVGGNGGNGGAGGLFLPALPACAPGVLPSREAPCKFDPSSLPECAEGVMPSPTAPCKPEGLNPQFDMAPPPEATKKLLTLDVEVDGSGEEPGTFDVTLVAIKKGVAKAARAQMQEMLEGESFIIDARKAKCFADKKSDPDAVADKVSCKVLSEQTDDVATTLKATVVTRMKFDAATRQPTFTATKFVIRGKSKI